LSRLRFHRGDESFDVAIDDSLAGFSFESTTDPASIDWTFDADAIGGTSSNQIPMQTIVSPEPATGFLFAAGLAAQAIARRRTPQI